MCLYTCILRLALLKATRKKSAAADHERSGPAKRLGVDGQGVICDFDTADRAHSRERTYFIAFDRVWKRRLGTDRDSTARTADGESSLTDDNDL